MKLICRNRSLLFAALLFGMSVGCSSEKTPGSGQETNGNANDESLDSGTNGDSSTDALEIGVPDDTSGGSGQTTIIFGTHIGNPSMNLVAAEENEPLVADIWTISTALMNISTIKLKPASTEMDKWEGPYRYDLLSANSTPTIAAATLSDGTYKKLEFMARPLTTADSEDDPLAGHSLFISGQVQLDGDATPFEVRFKNNEKFTIESSQGLKIEADVANQIGVFLDASLWFDGLDLANVTLSDEGVLILSNNDNKKLYQALRKNIKASSSMGVDKDKDGELDADEQVDSETEDDSDAAE